MKDSQKGFFWFKYRTSSRRLCFCRFFTVFAYLRFATSSNTGLLNLSYLCFAKFLEILFVSCENQVFFQKSHEVPQLARHSEKKKLNVKKSNSLQKWSTYCFQKKKFQVSKGKPISLKIFLLSGRKRRFHFFQGKLLRIFFRSFECSLQRGWSMMATEECGRSWRKYFLLKFFK